MARRRGPTFTSKKHLARVQRERLLRNYILIITAIVVLIVIGLVGFGFFEASLLQPRQPVATVNGESISTGDFQTAVRFQRLQLVNQYVSTFETMQQFTEDANFQSFFANSLQQIQLQLDNNTALGRQVLDDLIDDRLIRQEARRLEIDISAEEVDRAVQEAFGYFALGTPAPTTGPTLIPTSTLSPTQLALVTATPTAEATETPEEQLTPAEDADPTPTLEPPPTATPYTFEAFQSDFRQRTAELDREIGFDEQKLRALIESQLILVQLIDTLTTDLPREQDELWARRVLVEDEATAIQVAQRLEDGEDWTAVAEEFSEDEISTGRSGDLGWFSRDEFAEDFTEIVFGMPIGRISEPFETSEGWNVVQVLGHERRSVPPSEYDLKRQQAFQAWLTGVRNDAEIEIFDYWVDRRTFRYNCVQRRPSRCQRLNRNRCRNRQNKFGQRNLIARLTEGSGLPVQKDPASVRLYNGGRGCATPPIVQTHRSTVYTRTW